MPPNIAGLSLIAWSCAEESDPEITIVHEHGPIEEDGEPQWGYSAEHINMPAFAARTIYALQQYLDEDPAYTPRTLEIDEPESDFDEAELAAAVSTFYGEPEELQIHSTDALFSVLRSRMTGAPVTENEMGRLNLVVDELERRCGN